MPGSKGLNPHELAHKWMKDLGTRPNMSLKVGCKSHDMRIIGRIVGVHSTEQSAGIILQIGEYLQTSFQYSMHMCDSCSVIGHWDACILSTFYAIFHFTFI